jgi:hypothetical protein
LHQVKPDALVHCGFGFALSSSTGAGGLGWDPPLLGTRCAWIKSVMWQAIMGWIGLDQYDEENPIANLHRYQMPTAAAGILSW